MRLYAEVSWVHLLLRGFGVAPLLIHYLRTNHRPACKKMEFFKETKCGIDLPAYKKCSCGEKLKIAGFGIATASISPLRKWMEITVSKNGTAAIGKKNVWIIILKNMVWCEK